ncbi:MAG: MmgE/PrpD family protein [Hyphomicrobiaceae bacterium]|nr:MmgE/PrpD family protein [Hyphomicrobiaceae bacterium]
MKTAIAELARFAAETPRITIPREVRDFTATLVLDLLAAASAGAASPLARTARRAGRKLYGRGDTAVWFTEDRLSWLGAAFVNASAASALDIDDGHRGACGHAGAGVIPAVLALAETGDFDGQAIVDAIIVGYEVALRIASSRPTSTIVSYASGKWVAYGVAAAAGRLLGLNAEQTAEAMAIAGAESPVAFPSGTSRRQGSTVKEGIPPAVVIGLMAAMRAEAGGSGPVDLLDNPDLFTPAILTGGLGSHWQTLGNYLKPYACCRYIHPAIDAIGEMRQPGKSVKHLGIELFPQGLKLGNVRAPGSLEEGQYSYPFSCSLAALRGIEALQPVRLETLADEEVLALASRVELAVAPDFVDAFPSRTPARVTIDYGDGPQTRTVNYPLGDTANPLSRTQVEAKFRQLSKGALDPAAQEALVAAVAGLDARGPSPLFAVLGAKARP